MEYIFLILLKTHLYLICIVLGAYALEKVTSLDLFFWQFKKKKSKYMAEGSANLSSILYFLFSLFLLLYHVYYKKDAPEDYAFWKWLVIILPLAVLLRYLYFKHTARDPTKEGVHYG